MSLILCKPKTLPLGKLAEAARRSVEINPENATGFTEVESPKRGRRSGARRIAVVVAHKWPKSGVNLSVSFLDNPPKSLRSRILEHMNAWSESANVSFRETAGKTGEVRIARLDSPASMAGYWSYVGNQILLVDENEPTLNLQGFTMQTSDAEFRRVVRHEAGHTLGFDHEHMRSDIVKRIDRKKAVAYFHKTDGWTAADVDAQVLTPLAESSIMGTAESDPLSIMCYQLPAAIMKDGKPVEGGKDINAKDFAFAASLYPIDGAAKQLEAPAVAGPRAADEEVDTFHLVIMDQLRPAADGQNGINGRSPKYARVFASYGGARVTSTLRLRSDKGEKKTSFARIIGVHERVKAYTNREHGSLPSDDEMVDFGGLLFETLFQGDVRRLYDEARTRQRRRRLDLVLTSMIPWISEKPWEFAYDTGRQSFLATEEIHFVRNVLTNIPADPISRGEGPLRILVAAAQPVGFGLVSIDQEVEVIRRGFQPLIDEGLVDLEVLARATPGRIHGYLSAGSFHIVHFIGHGVFDEQSKEGCLVFENDRGGKYMLGERSVREIFCRRGLSMVFLNACESGRGGRAEFNKGVAQSLVAHGLPALVANQYSVLDSSATSFAQHFYWSLGQGLSVGQAAREARIAVNYSLHGEPIDWAVPVLYARDPSMTLSAARKSRKPFHAVHVHATSRRAAAGRESRVGVWDVDDAFPSLDQTLRTMNDGQSVFGFEVVDLSAPLDAFELNREEGADYLWAERVARRLQSKPAELGVDVIACVTSHWLRDDNWLNLYGWWPDDGTPPVVILSFAGFDQLEPEGPDTDRAIANALVACLAGFYGDMDAHDGGAKDCPMWFNEARSFKHLVAPQKFEAGCKRRLARKAASKLPALEALLAVFGT